MNAAAGIPAAALAAMTAFYADLDAELAGLGLACGGCGGCCRFDRADHVLYASRLERLYLAAVEPTPETPGGTGDAARLVARGLRCPYQGGRRCLARRGRALGCRLHFCGAPAGSLEELSMRRHAGLRELHDRFGAAWEYAPLLPLRDGGGGGG